MQETWRDEGKDLERLCGGCLLLVFNAGSFQRRRCDENLQLFKMDGDKSPAMVEWSVITIAILPRQRWGLKFLKRKGQVIAERLRALVAEVEAANSIHPERDKPPVTVPVELHQRLLLLPFLQDEPLRRHAPPVRLERENKDARVQEELALLRHSKGCRTRQTRPRRS